MTLRNSIRLDCLTAGEKKFGRQSRLIGATRKLQKQKSSLPTAYPQHQVSMHSAYTSSPTMTAPEPTGLKGIWSTMLTMVGDDGDIKNIINRDKEDLNWVEDYHTKHRDPREPLYLRFEEAKEITAWKERQGSGVLHINCDILGSTPQSGKRHTTPLSTFCWGWINDVRNGYRVPTDNSPGALVFFMGGYYRRERHESRPVGLTLMTSLIYQVVDLYGRKVCPDEAGESLSFESNKRNDIEYLCEFFKTLRKSTPKFWSLERLHVLQYTAHLPACLILRNLTSILDSGLHLIYVVSHWNSGLTFVYSAKNSSSDSDKYLANAAQQSSKTEYLPVSAGTRQVEFAGSTSIEEYVYRPLILTFSWQLNVGEHYKPLQGSENDLRYLGESSGW
ncbi:hypothetical protein BDP67DRAFT_495736 [Colletotrichum lupini]|nr:hypothetical protein BDP67DRAFT_495736 [Colletotrichum lupini]